MREYKEGDIIIDTLNWEWIFINHNGKLYLYPMEFYNNGKLSEGVGAHECSYLHDPKTWDLSTVRFIGNIK